MLASRAARSLEGPVSYTSLITCLLPVVLGELLPKGRHEAVPHEPVAGLPGLPLREAAHLAVQVTYLGGRPVQYSPYRVPPTSQSLRTIILWWSGSTTFLARL